MVCNVVDAWTARIVEFQPRIWAYLCALGCNEEWAEELAQVTILRCWERRSRYEERGCFAAWVLRIAANIYHDALRQRAREPIVADISDNNWQNSISAVRVARDLITSNRTPLDILIQMEWLQLLDDSLDRLNAVERHVLYLRYHAELSGPRIARQLGMPLGTVLSLAHRAQLKLRRELAA